MSKSSGSRRDGGALFDLCRREAGRISSRSFARRRGAALELVLRLENYRKLEGHKGCVNTISFNGDGGIVISGSDDKTVKLWDWETGRLNLSFHSGHASNVFQAQFMPFSDDRSIVTCAADGQVRHAHVLEGGEVQTVMLSRHEGRAHKLAIEPGSPHLFYTCGDDGIVQHFDLRTAAARKLFICHARDPSSYVPVVHLNAISIDPRNPNLLAVAGSDEYARVYDIRRYEQDCSSGLGQPIGYFCPPHLIGNDIVGITGLSISDQSELLVSYNDESIYLFTKDMGLGSEHVPSFQLSLGDDDVPMNIDLPISTASASKMDTDEKYTPQRYTGHRNYETMKGVNFFGPNCEYVVSGSDCGHFFIWEKRSGELIRVIEADSNVVNCIESHPHTMVLASSGIDNDIKIWTPKATEKATLPVKICSRPKARGWIHPLASSSDLWTQLIAMGETSRTSAVEHSSSNNAVLARELFDLLLTFEVTSDGSDDGRDTGNSAN
ncbi:hypothetical protein QQ045_032011 [Rhodiola kirilowii]